MKTTELETYTKVSTQAIVGEKCYAVTEDNGLPTYTIWDGNEWIGSYRDYQGELERVDTFSDFISEVERVGFND